MSDTGASINDLYTPGRVREVYVLPDAPLGDPAETYALCDACISETTDPAATRADVIRRDDAAHCVNCDYHADPKCRPGHWCHIHINEARRNDDGLWVCGVCGLVLIEAGDALVAPDDCACGHDGYDGHDMRSVPPECMTPGCLCGQQRVIVQRIVEADGTVVGWIVDVEDSPLYDTSSRLFQIEADARTFAGHLADLLITRDPEDREDDVR